MDLLERGVRLLARSFARAAQSVHRERNEKSRVWILAGRLSRELNSRHDTKDDRA